MKNLLKYIFLGLAVSFLAGCGDSGSKKWRLDNKELTADEVANLKIAIAFRDEIIQKNEWAKLNGDFWSDILVFFPEEAKRCRELKGFEKFDGSNWAISWRKNRVLKKIAKKIADGKRYPQRIGLSY